MTKEEFQSIQNVQLKIMDDIHRVCCECGYRYYLIGGSALGAVRHKGIIPWDVDIDIAMPRKDYEEFIKNGYRKLKKELSLHYYETDDDFATVHALVVMNNSEIKFRGESSEGIRYGIFVDVLPLDQWPEDKEEKIKQQRDLKRIQSLRAMRFGIKYASTSKSKLLLKQIGKFCISFLYSKKYLNMKQQLIMQRHNTEKEGKEWCSMVSHYSFDKTTFRKEVFGKPRLHDFSGRQFYVPEKVEEYLTHLFGNYMKIPSEESRKKQMNSVLYASWIKDGVKIIVNNDK